MSARLCRADNHAHSKRDEFLIHRPTGPEIVYMPQGLNERKEKLTRARGTQGAFLTVFGHRCMAHHGANKSAVKKVPFSESFLALC